MTKTEAPMMQADHYAMVDKALQSHPGYAKATQRLLEMRRAEAQAVARFDQAKAAAAGTENLAQDLLDGGEMPDPMEQGSQLYSLRLQVKTAREAVRLAEEQLRKEHRLAAATAREKLLPEFRQHRADFLQAIEQFTEAFGGMQRLNRALLMHEVPITKALSIVCNGDLPALTARLNYIHSEWKAHSPETGGADGQA